MPNLIDKAQDLMANSLSAEAAQAAKDLAVNTTVSGLQKISQGLNNYVTQQYGPNAQKVINDPKTTSADLEGTLADKQNTLGLISSGIDQMKAVADKLGPLATDPKIQGAITQTLNDAQKTLDDARKAVEDLKRVLEEKKKQEAATATNTGTDTGTGTGG